VSEDVLVKLMQNFLCPHNKGVWGRGNIDPLILNLAPPALTAGKEILVAIEYEAGCASEPIWTLRIRQNLLPLIELIL
jgi:hypothetical protein